MYATDIIFDVWGDDAAEGAQYIKNAIYNFCRSHQDSATQRELHPKMVISRPAPNGMSITTVIFDDKDNLIDFCKRFGTEEWGLVSVDGDGTLTWEPVQKLNIQEWIDHIYVM